MKYYLKAANGGIFRAAFNLARLYQQGDDGVNANPVESVEYFRQAIEAGYLKAALNLGNLYRKGADGVQKDLEEAIRLFRIASDSGQVKSTFALVDLFIAGDKVELQLTKALSLLEKAFRSVSVI